ncbi:MAG: endo-1,4-beta-xylanase, partial [Candidatus Brocadiae bacterium]|nr:endo-1,4-beta-xylanase [Candidatus Brocadiia bacterium]
GYGEPPRTTYLTPLGLAGNLPMTLAACFVALAAALPAPAAAAKDPLGDKAIEARIRMHRTAGVTLTVLDASGKPLAGKTVTVRQVRHAFLFGCNIFSLEPESTSAAQKAYQQRYAALLNYATLPFYWGSFERRQGATATQRIRAMADWCKRRGIRTKGHPLVWHEVYPAWADRQETPALQLLEARVEEVVGSFRGLVDMWDVINESTTSERFDNGVGEWARQVGMVEIAAESIRWARSAGPDATLVLNDYNISADFEAQIEGILAGERRPDVIGIQSHMHSGEWPLERAWEVPETYARFGLPLHFTELSVLSGAHIPQGEIVGKYRPDDWPSTPEGEETQLDYVEKLYTILFSHPAVEAVTWWDLADGQWMNAPSGLIRRDMSPKPAYERLLELVMKEWRTNAELTTDADGEASLRAFHGSYSLRDAETGESICFDHTAEEPASVVLALD